MKKAVVGGTGVSPVDRAETALRRTGKMPVPPL